MGLYGPKWNLMGRSGPKLDYMGLIGTIWDYVFAMWIVVEARTC